MAMCSLLERTSLGFFQDSIRDSDLIAGLGIGGFLSGFTSTVLGFTSCPVLDALRFCCTTYEPKRREARGTK